MSCQLYNMSTRPPGGEQITFSGCQNKRTRFMASWWPSQTPPPPAQPPRLTEIGNRTGWFLVHPVHLLLGLRRGRRRRPHAAGARRRRRRRDHPSRGGAELPGLTLCEDDRLHVRRWESKSALTTSRGNRNESETRVHAAACWRWCVGGALAPPRNVSRNGVSDWARGTDGVARMTAGAVRSRCARPCPWKRRLNPAGHRLSIRGAGGRPQRDERGAPFLSFRGRFRDGVELRGGVAPRWPLSRVLCYCFDDGRVSKIGAMNCALESWIVFVNGSRHLTSSDADDRVSDVQGASESCGADSTACC